MPANSQREMLDKVLLDITDLTKLDSYCITLIVRTHASLRAQGGDLKLLHPGGHVLEVFKTLHLLKLIPRFEDEIEAFSSFGPVVALGSSDASLLQQSVLSGGSNLAQSAAALQ